MAAAVGADSAAAPGTAVGERVRTNYLVFIDDFFSIQRDRDRVLDRLKEDLGELQDGDRVAMVAFDGKKLDMLTTWTNDPGDLERAFRTAQQRKAHGLGRLAEVRSSDQERLERHRLTGQITRILGQSDTNNFLDTELDGPDRAFATKVETQVERSVLAAVSALRSFAGPEGRKVMLILSGGWPVSPAEYAFNDISATIETVNAGFLDQTFKNRRQLFSPAQRHRQPSGLHDLPGWTCRGSAGPTRFLPNSRGQTAATHRQAPLHRPPGCPENRSSTTATSCSPTPPAVARSSTHFVTVHWRRRSPTRELSTGSASSPLRLDDDARHDIEIEVRGRKDLQVRAREGFVDLSRSAEVTMIVESALLFGDPPSTIPLGTKFGRPVRSGPRKMKVSLEVAIPMDEVTLLPTEGLFVNEVEIRITVMDDDGSRSETKVEKVLISGPQRPQPGQRYFYETELTLRRRDHRIVVAVYDPLSQVIMSSTGEIGPAR